MVVAIISHLPPTEPKRDPPSRGTGGDGSGQALSLGYPAPKEAGRRAPGLHEFPGPIRAAALRDEPSGETEKVDQVRNGPGRQLPLPPVADPPGWLHSGRAER